MQFSIQQSDLINPLVNLLRNTTALEFYKNIQIEAVDNDHIKLTSSNGVNTLEYTLKADNVSGDSLMINAKEFTEIVGRLRGWIQFEDGLIKNDKKKIKLGVINETRYTANANESENAKEFDFNALKSVIKNRIFAVEQKMVNSPIGNLCINGDEIVATNGNIMSIGRLSVDTGFDSLLVSRDLANEIIQCFESETINIATNNNEIIIYNDILKLRGKKVAGVYPPYKQLIPNNYHKYLKLDKHKVIENLDLMLVIADSKSPVVKITLDKGLMTLQSGFSDNEGISELDVDYTFEPMTIAFNIQYLIGVLKNTNDDVVELQLGDSNLSAAVVKGATEQAIIMPIQLRG